MSIEAAVYILTDEKRGLLYTGVTRDLHAFTCDHLQGKRSGIPEIYELDLLIYFETFEDIHFALSAAKNINHASHHAKCVMIERTNPAWKDLCEDVLFGVRQTA